jgi:hypothetical protein
MAGGNPTEGLANSWRTSAKFSHLHCESGGCKRMKLAIFYVVIPSFAGINSEEGKRQIKDLTIAAKCTSTVLPLSGFQKRGYVGDGNPDDASRKTSFFQHAATGHGGGCVKLPHLCQLGSCYPANSEYCWVAYTLHPRLTLPSGRWAQKKGLGRWVLRPRCG